MAELDYNPSKKDLTDAKIHHLLAEELKPYRRVCIIDQMQFPLHNNQLWFSFLYRSASFKNYLQLLF